MTRVIPPDGGEPRKLSVGCTGATVSYDNDIWVVGVSEPMNDF